MFPVLAQAASRDGDLFVGFIVLSVIGLIYFAPWAVAIINGHQSTTGIFVLNLFLGWTFIGWVIALIWSVTNIRQRP